MINRNYSLGKIVCICPACGRKTFKPYVDADGVPLDALECGRCNREINCQYHCPPREYFNRHPGIDKNSVKPVRKLPILYETPSFIEWKYLQYSMNKPLFSNLTVYLKVLFGMNAVFDACRRMYVGYSPSFGGSVIFWYVDHMGNIRTGKNMGFTIDGHRCKNPNQIYWVHKNRNIASENFVMRQCFFGSHQLMNSDTDRCTLLFVESEKTALILTICLLAAGIGGYLVFATGGSSNLKVDLNALKADIYYRWKPFMFRKLVLIPDADMYDSWRKTDLRALHSPVHVINPSDLRLTGSMDVGDLLVADGLIGEIIDKIPQGFRPN